MITREEARKIYRTMAYIRYVEESIAKEYKNGYMRCPVHLYIGQEAVAAGVCLNLIKDDLLVTNHRSHGHYLAKGGNLEALISELCGFSSGCSKGWGGSQHVYEESVGILGTTALVGAGISIGTGMALALKMKGLKNISVMFFGDGATEEGYFYESLNFASLKKLPALYVCENNFLATHSRIETRRINSTSLNKISKSLGVKSVRINGNDAAGVFETMKEIVQTVRKRCEPYFVEAVTYRWKGHVSPDEEYGARYRTLEEIEKWKKKCPIRNFTNKAIKNKLLSPADIKNINEDIKIEVDKIFHNLREIVNNKKAPLVPVTPY